jgi:hypothetical protein
MSLLRNGRARALHGKRDLFDGRARENVRNNNDRTAGRIKYAIVYVIDRDSVMGWAIGAVAQGLTP